jgi:hypothetical protein
MSSYGRRIASARCPWMPLSPNDLSQETPDLQPLDVQEALQWMGEEVSHIALTASP